MLRRVQRERMTTGFQYDVFLRHSSKDKPVVRELAARLKRDGVRVWFDEEQIKHGDSIPSKVEEGLEHSRVLVLCMSANAYGSDWAQLEAGTFRFRDPLNKERRFIPLRLDDAPIRGSLAQFIYIDWSAADREQAYVKLLQACRLPVKADLSHILRYAPAEFIGREVELQQLNDAWAKVQNSTTPRPHILTFVGLGGEGKTSLVAKWAAGLAAQDWPGCDAAFAWSFYSQGTREQLAVSSDLFLKEAITFFGDDADKAFAVGPAGAFEKGQRLARLVGQRRSLLILDGLDTLQFPPGPSSGSLKDQGVAALLKGLAASNRGLCVITTRCSMPDLQAFWQTTAPEVKLLRLSRDAGVHLLQTLGVRGGTEELAAAAEDMNGHALNLTLLGSYLRDAHEGDIRKRDLVKLEEADAGAGGHGFSLVAAYAKWLDGEGHSGRQALEILRLLGLADRPLFAEQVDELLKPPAISGLTESLIGIDEPQCQIALARLEAAQFLIVSRGVSGELVAIDSHPLVRAYFLAQMRKDNPNGLQAGLNRLEAYENQLKQRATPLRLCFESERFTADEIAEILGYFSDYYEAISGDRLVIESQGTLETSGVLVPQGA